MISPALGVLVVLKDANAERGGRLKRLRTGTCPDRIRETAARLAEATGLVNRIVVWRQAEVADLYICKVVGRLAF